MKRWHLIPLLSASLLPLTSAHADDLSSRATQTKSQLQNQWLPQWAKTSTANETAIDAANNLQTLSHAHLLGYSTAQMDLLAAASAHYKLLRDSRRDKTNDGFYARPQDSKELLKSTLLQAQVVEALAEYARASGEAEPRGLAIKTWRLIRDRSRDKIKGGYYDSLLNGPLGPTQGSGKGNKSAQTHLALLEAGTGLFELTHDRSIKADLMEMLDLNQGRFFATRPEERVGVYSPDWQMRPQTESPDPSSVREAGVAIARAQTALGLPIGWVDLARRTETVGPSATPATVSALTALTQIASYREERATQLETALDGMGTSSTQVQVGSGIALLDFVAAFEK